MTASSLAQRPVVFPGRGLTGSLADWGHGHLVAFFSQAFSAFSLEIEGVRVKENPTQPLEKTSLRVKAAPFNEDPGAARGAGDDTVLALLFSPRQRHDSIQVMARQAIGTPNDVVPARFLSNLSGALPMSLGSTVRKTARFESKPKSRPTGNSMSTFHIPNLSQRRSKIKVGPIGPASAKSPRYPDRTSRACLPGEYKHGRLHYGEVLP